MRNALTVLFSVLVFGAVAAESGAAEQGSSELPIPQDELQIEI